MIIICWGSVIVIAAGPGECDLYWDNRSIGRCTAQLAFIGHFSSAVWQSTIKQQVFRNSAVVPLGNDF